MQQPWEGKPDVTASSEAAPVLRDSLRLRHSAPWRRSGSRCGVRTALSPPGKCSAAPVPHGGAQGPRHPPLPASCTANHLASSTTSVRSPHLPGGYYYRVWSVCLSLKGEHGMQLHSFPRRPSHAFSASSFPSGPWPGKAGRLSPLCSTPQGSCTFQGALQFAKSPQPP